MGNGINSELRLYEFFVNGEKWNDPEETYSVPSDNPYNALTKLRILYGESVYRRCYGCYDCENQEIVRDLYSYPMLREQIKRDYGRKYYYNMRRMG